jgi:hypothetical protein
MSKWPAARRLARKHDFLARRPGPVLGPGVGRNLGMAGHLTWHEKQQHDHLVPHKNQP